MRVAVVGLALAACGRYGFTPAPANEIDAASSPADAAIDAKIDDVAPDAPPLAPLFVQFGDAVQPSSTSIAASTPQPAAVGDLLLVTLQVDNTGQLQSMSDTTGDQFVLLPALVAKDSSHSYIAYAIIGTSSVETVTVTLSAAAQTSLRVHEYTRVDPSDPIDLYQNNTGVLMTGGPIDVPLTTTHDGELLFGYAIGIDGGAMPGPGFQTLSTASGDISEDAPATTAGAYDVVAIDSSTSWVLWAIALRGI